MRSDRKEITLDRQTLAWLRWSGIAGIAGSVGYMIGDALLLGNSASATGFPHLATYLDNRLVQRGAVFLGSSTERLAAGGLIGVFSTPLYLAGIWHIFEASKPGGTRWSSRSRRVGCLDALTRRADRQYRCDAGCRTLRSGRPAGSRPNRGVHGAAPSPAANRSVGAISIVTRF